MNANQLKFDLTDKNLNEEEFKFLITNILEANVMVNGYVLEWKYHFEDNIVLMEAVLKKIK